MTSLHLFSYSYTAITSKGAIHHLDYPLFFAYIDLEQIQSIRWSMWPIFQLDRGWTVFCSLNCSDHLKGYSVNSKKMHPLAINNTNSTNKLKMNSKGTVVRDSSTLLEKVRHFAASSTKSNIPARDVNISDPIVPQILPQEEVPKNSDVTLLTHLTYFGYCFNPVSFYYIFRESTPTATGSSGGISRVHTIVTEVSNTPWNEQHRCDKRFNVVVVTTPSTIPSFIHNIQ